jgi:hypothetical protein
VTLVATISNHAATRHVEQVTDIRTILQLYVHYSLHLSNRCADVSGGLTICSMSFTQPYSALHALSAAKNASWLQQALFCRQLLSYGGEQLALMVLQDGQLCR